MFQLFNILSCLRVHVAKDRQMTSNSHCSIYNNSEKGRSKKVSQKGLVQKARSKEYVKQSSSKRGKLNE